ncbi:hypothetical protein [Saliphagus sp. LR7]|uniref:hypothetical protein n=1 Tax=Saliphagus sp. LR7 TaxID=2282654 RepID=UPI000DF7A6CC|nr:hypothetical protein [Saliphagus sp. LR7]
MAVLLVSLALVASLGVTAVAVAPADGGVVAAQEDGDNGNESDGPGDQWPSGNESAGNESENESGNESGGGDGSGGGGLLDRAGSAIGSANPVPSPAEAAEDVWEWISTQLQEMMTTLVDTVFNELLGTPTIENDGAMGIMGSPVDPTTAEEIDANDDTNGGFATQNYTNLYHSVYLVYVIPLVGGVLGVMALTVLVGPSLSAFTQRRMFTTVGTAALAVFLVVASWEFAALMHAFSDGVTQHFLPTGGEVLDFNRTIYSGPLAVTIGLLASGGTTGIALLALHAVRHMLLYVAPIALPALILLAYWGGHQRVKQVGSFFIWQWYALLVWNWPTAVLLRVAYELNWMFHSSDLINIGMTMAIFLIAVAIPLAVSGSFTLIGLSMRGAAASAAGGAFASIRNRSRSAAPEPTGESRTRRAGRRLRSGASWAGAGAANRASGAYGRASAAVNRRRGVDNTTSGPAPSKDRVGKTPSSRRAAADGGSIISRSRSRTSRTGITPGQRQRTNHKGATASKPKKRLQRTDNGNYRVIDR